MRARYEGVGTRVCVVRAPLRRPAASRSPWRTFHRRIALPAPLHARARHRTPVRTLACAPAGRWYVTDAMIAVIEPRADASVLEPSVGRDLADGKQRIAG